jgi:hypothetical protein
MSITTFCRWTCCCLIATMALFTGCAPKYVEFPVTLSPQAEQIGKVPLRAGLCMPSEFREFVVPMYRQDYQTSFGSFGKALSTGAEQVAKRIFRDVVVLGNAAEAGAQQVDVVVTPTVDRIAFNYDASTATVKVKWTITDVSGKVLYMNTFIGEGDGKGTSIRYPTKLKHACTRAINDHFDKALVGLSDKRWWQAVVSN